MKIPGTYFNTGSGVAGMVNYSQTINIKFYLWLSPVVTEK